jgi:hypothetical protein
MAESSGRAFLANWSSYDAPFRTKARLAVANSWKKLRTGSGGAPMTDARRAATWRPWPVTVPVPTTPSGPRLPLAACGPSWTTSPWSTPPGALLLLEAMHLPVYHFPPEDVRTDLLQPTDRSTHCPYKGDASYWSVIVGDRVEEDIAWSYPFPIPECPKIQNLVAFFNERADIWVDGELQPKPETPWSRQPAR